MDSEVLFSSIKNAEIDEFKRIIKDNGINVNEVKDKYNVNLLHVAAKYNKIEIARYLLKHDMNVDAPTNGKLTALYIAVINDHAEMVEFLLTEYKANTNIIAKRNLTPLHIAVMHGNIKIVQLLLDHGADKGAQSDIGNTPLHNAVAYNHIDIVRLLIEHDADTNAENNYQQPPLFLSHLSNIEMIKLLIDNRADLHYKSEKNENNFLHYASTLGCAKLIKCIVKQFNVNDANKHGQTALHLAAMQGYINAREKSLIPACVASGQFKKDSTRKASITDYLETITILIENGADINAQDYFGDTPLHYASFYAPSLYQQNSKEFNKESFVISKYLMNHGANLNIKDKNEQTPRDIGMFKSYSMIIKNIMKSKKVSDMISILCECR